MHHCPEMMDFIRIKNSNTQLLLRIKLIWVTSVTEANNIFKWNDRHTEVNLLDIYFG